MTDQFRLADWITECDSEDENNVYTWFECEACGGVGGAFEAVNHSDDCSVGEVERLTKQRDALVKALDSLHCVYPHAHPPKLGSGDKGELRPCGTCQICAAKRAGKAAIAKAEGGQS